MPQLRRMTAYGADLVAWLRLRDELMNDVWPPGMSILRQYRAGARKRTAQHEVLSLL
jgi:hypothetical protein